MNTLISFLGAVAGDLLSEFNSNAMVDNAVNGSCRGHGIFEDLIPLRKDQVSSNDDAAALVVFSQRGEENSHFIAGLLDVADVVEDQYFKVIQEVVQGFFACLRSPALVFMSGLAR